MKIPAYILIALLLLVVACSGEAPLARLPADAVILAFGDSLTYGKGAKSEESYPAVLAKLSGRQVVNAGVSGELSEAGLARLPDLLAEHQPHLLILCHGGNHFLRKKGSGGLEANIRAMIILAKSKKIEVVLLGVPRPGLFLSSAELYRKVADTSDVVFIEDLIADVLGDNSLKSDTVHPNSKGYRRMAEIIYERLKEAGAW